MQNKLVFAFTLMLFNSFVLAQEVVNQPTQNPDATYRLFNTQNIFTLLKLDTRVGTIWQVQWGSEDERFVTPISLKELAPAEETGRFTLYPTSNIYTFILLDQKTGNTWHVQWGGPGERFIAPIE